LRSTPHGALSSLDECGSDGGGAGTLGKGLLLI
jgi:hypothetical protein